MANTVRVVLNHPNVRRILEEDETIGQIIEDAASDIEVNVMSAHQDSVALAKGEGKDAWVKDVTPTVFNEKAENSDRQRRFVGIDPGSIADYFYGTLPKAIENAGGTAKDAGKFM